MSKNYSKKLRIILIFSLPFFLWGLCRFCHFATKGFSMAKIRNNFSAPTSLVFDNPEQDLDPTLKRCAFSQKYTYLGRGLQSFCFLSEDHQFVIKFFSNRSRKDLFFSKLLKFFPTQRHKYKRIKRDILKTNQSYALSFKELKSETGLLYLHLHPTTSLHQIITLLDPLGIPHQISLDEIGFAIQKKATPLYSQLLKWKAENNEQAAKKGISQLIHFLIKRCQRGIGDDDPLLRTNCGFCNDEPMFIDLGPFFWDPSIKDPKNYIPEIMRITTSLKIWLYKNYPLLCSYLEEQLSILLQLPKE